MKRFSTLCIVIVLGILTLMSGCSSGQVDRSKELRDAMDTCDSKWSQSFPAGAADFTQAADYIAGWGGNAGLEVTRSAEHYIILTNPASKGQKDAPSVTIAMSMDPTQLRDCVPLLSLGMTSVLGPVEHGRIRLIISEAADDEYIGAKAISSKYLKCDHFIYLYRGGSGMVYTTGPLSAEGRMTCKAKRTAPSYSKAFEISVEIPTHLNPYAYDQKESLPNPINVLGDLLASAKSSGRLFEIASFTAEENGDFLPSHAKAVVVVDENNVESFQKRFDKSSEGLQKRFNKLDTPADEDGNPLEPLVYTMEPVDLPGKVLKQSAADNLISLMYTLQTGIHLQDENTGAVTAASYIRSVSTKKGKFSLTMDMRSRDTASMEEMSSNYKITSGLCDVDYSSSKQKRLWSSAKDSSLAAWFIATVNGEGDDTSVLQSSECDRLYAKNKGLDMIAYRYDKDDRGTALTNILSYLTSLSTQE